MEISHFEVGKIHPTIAIPTKQAWAAYVRRRWPRDCVSHVQREWDLTADRARGIVFATISQSTVDQIRAHRNGGPRVMIEVEAVAMGTDFRGLISRLLADEGVKRDAIRRDCEAAERLDMALAARLGVGVDRPRRPDAQQEVHRP